MPYCASFLHSQKSTLLPTPLPPKLLEPEFSISALLLREVNLKLRDLVFKQKAVNSTRKTKQSLNILKQNDLNAQIFFFNIIYLSVSKCSSIVLGELNGFK